MKGRFGPGNTAMVMLTNGHLEITQKNKKRRRKKWIRKNLELEGRWQ